MKQGSGYKTDSGYKSESAMTPEQRAKMRQERIKSLLPSKPEEKVPSLIKTIKPFDKPEEKIPSLIETNKPINKPGEQTKEDKKKIRAEKNKMNAGNMGKNG